MYFREVLLDWARDAQDKARHIRRLMNESEAPEHSQIRKSMEQSRLTFERRAHEILITLLHMPDDL